MGRVFVTGDTHGSSDILKLTGKYWPEGRTLARDDLLVICGDFGLVWSDPPSEDAAFWLAWLNARPWTTLFLDGNHENHDLLDSFEVDEWCGGKVHVVPGCAHVRHLMRGQVYRISGHGTWFVMGGARSQDREWRVEGRTWWAREMPSEDEYDEATQNLEACNWAPDFVFTHDCATSRLALAMPWYLAHPAYVPPADALTDYLQFVDERLSKERLVAWYCGHYHQDCELGDEIHHLLYQQVVELGKAPQTNVSPGELVPGAGWTIPLGKTTRDEIATREHATRSEVAAFAEQKGDPTSPEGQAAFRRYVNALRRKALRDAGPHADIL